MIENFETMVRKDWRIFNIFERKNILKHMSSCKLELVRVVMMSYTYVHSFLLLQANPKDTIFYLQIVSLLMIIETI